MHTDLDRRTFVERALALLGAAGAAGASAAAGTESTPAPSTPRQPTLRFFPGFKAIRIQTREALINGVMGGAGPPVLLLHGFPQSHVQWRTIAQALAQDYTVVATDLRGYGDSSKPADGENHAGYSKRATAADQVEVMRQLGFDRFAVVGHDRGGRVGHRLALDHPAHVKQLAVLDIVPTYKLYSNVTKEFATAYYHWFLLIQPSPLPETLIGNSAQFYLESRFLRRPVGGTAAMAPEAVAEYLRCFKDPATLHAMCEDYRAAAGIDLEHDQADLDKKVECSLLALWGGKAFMERLFAVADTWRERATRVEGKALPGGHWLTEQLPDLVSAELRTFLSRPAS